MYDLLGYNASTSLTEKNEQFVRLFCVDLINTIKEKNQLLLNTSEKIEDLGIQVGHESIESFKRIFKKYILPFKSKNL